MSLREVFGLVMILTLCEYNFGCKKVYYVPAYTEPTWFANLYTGILNEVHPCSKAEVFESNDYLHLRSSSWDLVEDLKPKLQELSKLHPDGMHLIGISQGGHIARAIVQATSEHTVHSLITVSAAHNGLFAIPNLNYFLPAIFNTITQSDLFSQLAYSRIVQDNVPLAVLWKDPIHYSRYLSSNRFLPTLNNEIPHPNAELYKNNLLKLKHFVMIAGELDTYNLPYQSHFFGYYDKNMNIVNMTEQETYKNDTLGLKTLNESGRLHICLKSHMMHLDVGRDEQSIKDCMVPYLT